MLYMPKTTLTRVVNRVIVPNATIGAEGRALIAANVDGVVGVQESTGVSGTVFAGIGIYEKAPLESMPDVQELVVDTDTHQITLPYTPLGGTGAIRIYDIDDDVDIDAGNPGTTAGEYSLSGNVLTFNTAQDDHTMRIFYRYSPTVLQAKWLQGDIRAGGTAQAQYGKVGAILIGDVYTSEYDPTVDWSAANVSISAGANGLLTIGGNGPILPATILQVPSVDSPYLGLSLT